MSINAKNLPDAVNNQSLFSDYYLDSLIIEQPHWTNTQDIESDYAAIKALFDAVSSNAEHLNEAQTERELIQPLLGQLGHVFEVQPTLQTSHGAKRPDYAFFASSDAYHAAQPHVNTNEFFKTALAVGDAKAWSRNLDRKAQESGDPFNNQNPSYQVDFYLRFADKGWGILTNGRQWRLYHRQTSYRLDSFYEVDLAALLSDNRDLDAFGYFYCLFRRDAFIQDANGESFLDLVLGESQQYTVTISDDLKNRVYDALRLLIGGFLDFPRNGFDKANPPLDDIRSNCLILLYRSLFTLYAESRGLLPVENPNYAAHYSLAALAETIHETQNRGGLIIPTITDYWARLRGLFTLINEGWDDLIPQYNGGLFNPAHHPFLEKYELGNDSLAKVIELLTRTEAGERIAYRDLDVRHLGSIYEGLLEYQPQIANEDLVVVSKRGRETVAPKSSPKQEAAYQTGEVYLLTDKGERKATGSYYTPDYIVRYIVQNTLAPLCEGKSVEEILSLKILDPATGSGHFLVGVVDYLAEELITHPDAAHMTETASEETELAYWRRRVVESCVYGVDVNPMAVELAKLSLWLHTVAKGEPLSFLDHHIRCGNSLIGAKIENLSNLPQLKRSRRNTDLPQTEEIVMSFHFTDTVATAIGHYLLIEEMESRTADQIHAKEHQLDIAQTMLRFHKGVANLWTSVYFGNDVSHTDYVQALNSLRSKKTDTLADHLAYRQAQEIAAEKRFFHWEIEFPEVFRDKYGREKDNPGFDAVIGNPPYGAKLDELEKKFVKINLPAVDNVTDSFVVFTEKGLLGLARQGRIGLIVPSGWLTARMYRSFREWLHSVCTIEYIVHLPYDVFPDAFIDTIIFISHKTRSVKGRVLIQRYGMRESAEELASKTQGYLEVDSAIWQEDPHHRFLTLLSPLVISIHNKTKQFGTEAAMFLEVARGMTPYSVAAEGSQGARIGFWGTVGRYHIQQERIGQVSMDSLTECPSEDFFIGERLIIRRIISRQQRIHATYVDTDFAINKSYLLAISKNPSLSLFYLLALINAKLFSRLFIWFSEVAKRDDFPQLDMATIREFPIRRINFTTPADNRGRQLEKARTLYQFCLDKGSTDCVLGFVKHHLAAEPERSDVVHDLLAFLAEQMVEMNKSKGEEIRGFLNWLEREIGVEVEALRNKTAIQGYFDLSLEGLFDILKKNRRSIPIDLSKRDFQESLEREFTSSLAKLNPLLSRIQGTDELIDQVVYQLYGLTDEEIAVVEGEV